MIQKLLFDDSQLNRLKALLGYGDTARKCTAEVTALYLISAALHEWKSFRHCADAGVQLGFQRSNVPRFLEKPAILISM
ncbi:hypothetical protein NLX67_18670 [Domibacillus sp. A3M-37]|uniref:hypothetical protein n=1 Tax=Domibacillus sp. A3M-37 TaxID=2962037 RepID=UPI0020B79E5F|nr:hypothetical protein [Domibacillus sp. A3M-37]MCP3764370.1 hypothetical protein [Domibacillus sp. A3M-37]